MVRSNFLVNTDCGCDTDTPYDPAVQSFLSLLRENDYRWTKPVRDSFNELIASLRETAPAVKYFSLAFGDAPAILNGGPAPVAVANGQTATLANLVGYQIINLRQSNQPLEPVEGRGYSFNPITGTFQFDNAIYDENVYGMALPLQDVPPVTEIFLVFSPASSNKLVLNSNSSNKLIFNG